MDVIKVSKRDFAVKAKQLRRDGKIPGSVFGGPLSDSISLQIDEDIARRLIRHKREGSKLKLDLDGQLIPVQIKEIELNTIKKEILHNSFQALKADQKVKSVIHIILKNTEKITGLLETMLLEIPYAALPENMNDTITIELDGIKVGTVITVADIPELMSDKIDLQVDPNEIVLRVSDKRRSVEQPAEQADEEE